MGEGGRGSSRQANEVTDNGAQQIIGWLKTA